MPRIMSVLPKPAILPMSNRTVNPSGRWSKASPLGAVKFGGPGQPLGVHPILNLDTDLNGMTDSVRHLDSRLRGNTINPKSAPSRLLGNSSAHSRGSGYQPHSNKSGWPLPTAGLAAPGCRPKCS
jgi:hypothetical protein